MSAKGRKNKNPYVREGTDMNIAQIAKELNITQTEVETAIKGIFYKFKTIFQNFSI